LRIHLLHFSLGKAKPSEKPVIPMRSPIKIPANTGFGRTKVAYNLDESDDGVSGIPKTGLHRDSVPNDGNSSSGKIQ